MQKSVLFVVALTVATAQADAGPRAIRQLSKKRSAWQLGTNSSSLGTLYMSTGCGGSAYETELDKCLKWNTFSFKIEPLTGDDCVAGVTGMRATYWAANTTCSGPHTERKNLAIGNCTTVGQLSFSGTGSVPDAAFCPLYSYLATATRASRDTVVYVQQRKDCSGEGLSAPFNEDPTEPTLMDSACVGCCPLGAGLYSKHYTTCGPNGLLFSASATYTDATCQREFGTRHVGYASYGVCSNLLFGSIKTVFSEDFENATCGIVNLMTQHGIASTYGLVTLATLKEAMPFVGDLSQYGGYEGGSSGALIVSSMLLLLAACIALA